MAKKGLMYTGLRLHLVFVNIFLTCGYQTFNTPILGRKNGTNWNVGTIGCWTAQMTSCVYWHIYYVIFLQWELKQKTYIIILIIIINKCNFYSKVENKFIFDIPGKYFLLGCPDLT